jgi:hypothetical protein
MMKQISRIPKNGIPLEVAIAAEDEAECVEFQDIGFWMMELLEHDSRGDSIATTMDWAMEIRSTQGLSWAQSIRLAMIFYYG